MNFIYYKKIDKYLTKLSNIIKAEMCVEKDYIKLIKEKREVNIYFSEENYKFSTDSILLLEKGKDGCKYITFDLLDKIFTTDNSLYRKIFECWIFNEPYESYFLAFETLENKKNIFKEDNDLSDKKNNSYKSCSKLDVANVNDIISKCFKKEFVYNSKNKFFHTKDNSIICISLISKDYGKTSYNYWYSYHPYQKKIFEESINSYLLLSFKDSNEVLAIPSEFINKRLNRLGSSGVGEKKYWHLYIKKSKNKYELRIPKIGLEDITKYLVVKEFKRESDEEDLVINIKSLNTIVKNSH